MEAITIGGFDSPGSVSQATPAELLLWGIDVVPDTSILIFDHEYRYLLARGATVRDDTMSPESIEGRIAPEVLSPERWDFYRPIYEAALRGERSIREVPSPDDRRHYLVRAGPFHSPALDLVGGVAVATDVTELRRAQLEQAASERTFRLTFDSAPTGMAVVDLDRRFVDVNQALCRLLGHTRGWLLAHGMPDVLDPADNAGDLAVRREVLTGRAVSAMSEKRFIRSDGQPVWVHHSVGLLRDDHGTPVRYISQFVDISDAREARDELRFLATHDTLTGLSNRSHFVDRVEALLSHPPRSGTRLAVLYLDLDRFKAINDTLGHVVGDEVLRTIAGRIRSELRADDIVARFGGDEFVVTLTSLHDAQDAQAVAAQIHAAVREPVWSGGHRIEAAVSIGVAFLEPGEDIDDALSRADAALYRAKAGGGGRTVVADH